jgi:hypothetical protein
MRGGGKTDTITEWKRLAEHEPVDRLRSLYAALTLVFAELTRELVDWQKALENWNMRVSQIITEWKKEGELEGRLAARRDDLLLILETRFQLSVPPELKLAIEGTNDPDALSRWMKMALTVPTLDAFRAAMN